MDDTKTRIIFAAIKAVRQYGLEGVRIQNVSELAGVSPGALYRYFHSKEQMLAECFTYVDRQAAAIFDHLKFNPLVVLSDPMKAVKSYGSPISASGLPIRTRLFFTTVSGTARHFPNMTKPGMPAIFSPWGI